MEFFNHGEDGSHLFGWGLHRYRMGAEKCLAVVDSTRAITKPSSGGLYLTGCFDLYHDATVYHGLAAAFTIENLGASVVRAFRSSYDISVDYLLQPGGGRDANPGDAFVPGDNDLWSVGV